MFFYYAGVMACTWLAMSVLSHQWVREALADFALAMLRLAWFLGRLVAGMVALTLFAMTSQVHVYGGHWHALIVLPLTVYLFARFARYIERAEKAAS